MRKIFDLTHSYSDKFEGFVKKEFKTIGKDGWNASKLDFYSHCGTHMDAPIHFIEGGKTIDEFPIQNFIGKAWIIDARHVSIGGLITVEFLNQTVLNNFKPGDSLILWTNWSKKIHTAQYKRNLPRVAEDLALWCVKNKVKMLGVEAASVANVNDLEEVTRIHKILLKTVIIIEGLTNIDQLSAPFVELIALPLKIFKGDGAPARVIAIES